MLRAIGLLLLFCATTYGQTPLSVRLEAQLGHTETVTALALSPDARLAASASSGLVTLWDLESQRQIYQIHGTWPAVTSVGFLGDALLVTSLDARGGTSRFRLETGQPITSTAALNSCGGGAFLQTAQGKDQSAIRETRSGRILVQLPFSPSTHPYTALHDLACTADGRTAVIAVPTRELWLPEVWDLATGKRIRQLGPSSHNVSIVAVSADGKIAATVDEAAVVIHVWDIASGSELRQLTGLRDFTQQELTPRVAGSEALVANVAQHGARILAVAFSPDGKYIGATGLGSAIVWETQTGRQFSEFRQVPSQISAISFSPDSGRILLANSSGVVTMFDVALRPVQPAPGLIGGARTEAVQRAFLAGASGGRVSSLSPDGRYLFLTWNGENPLITRGDPLLNPANPIVRQVFGSNLYPTVYFDLKTGRSGQWPSDAQVFSTAFTPDGRSVVLGYANGTITVWDLEKQKMVRSIAGLTQGGAVTMLATDGKTLLAGYRNGSLRQMPLAGGTPQVVPLPAQVHADEVALSRDGSQMIVGFSSELAAGVDMLHSVLDDVSKLPYIGDLRLINAAGGGSEVVADLKTHLPPRGMAAFLPDGKSMAISDGANVSLYETAKGTKLRDLPNSASIRRLAVSSDGKKLIAATLAGELILWDLDPTRRVWSVPRHGNGQVLSVRFTDNDKRIFTVQSDSSAQFLNAANGRPLVTLSQFSDGKWVASTPEGRFDTPDLDMKLPVHWIASDAPLKPLAMELFQRDYFEPRLLTRVLAGETFPPIRNLAELNRLLPTVKINSITREGPGVFSPDGFTDNLTVKVEVTEATDPKTGRTSGARDVRLFRGGQLVAYAPAEDGPIPLQNGKAIIEFRNVRGPGVFAIHAFNNDGVKTPTHGYQYRADLGFIDVSPRTGRERSTLGSLGPQFNPPPAGRAWIVSIGVDQYALASLNLQYSGNDARRLATDLSTRLETSRQFEKVVTTQLISDSQHPDGATKEVIRQTIVSMAGTSSTSARPKDLIIISFSGHGYSAPDGKFYLVPSDAGKGMSESNISRERLLAQSISSDELAHWLRDIDAGRMVLIIDACQSAAALGGDAFKPGPMASRGLGQLAYDKGMTILAATQADNFALESRSVGHGLLTYALTQEGLENGAADWQPKDGRIELREWLRYAVNRVPELWTAIQSGEISRDLVYQANSPSPRPAAGTIRQEPAVFDFFLGGNEPVLVRPEQKPRP